jgi:hypothetical protein
LLEDVRNRVGTSDAFSLRECLVSAKEKIIVKGSLGHRDVVLKIPVELSALRGETTNAAILSQIATDPRFASVAPTPIAQGAFQNVPYFLESAVPGVALSTLITPARRAEAARIIGELFLSMHSSSTDLTTMATSDEPYQSLVADPIARLRAVGLEEKVVERIEAEFREGLTTRRWRLGVQHGDLTNSNVFMSNDAVSGLIDWEYAMPRGLPALDAIAYLESTERHVVGSHACDNLSRLARWEWRCSEELDMLNRLYRSLEIDPSAHALLCRMVWLRAVGFRLNVADRFDPGFTARWVLPMIRN